ncbi:hypothetical protein PV327_010098 [Microctonus hyperodae]|uniref:CD80-like immunoglobulin C2-set domain-containing protein n=1 Tax=Microctonus hyperodae TaxID=165561 RepID=A0AA39F2B7_MICHY|nr:hypothetical protein PV327_010098 [Microctonus hyperodae]
MGAASYFTDYETLPLASLPTTKPTIRSERRRYAIGDVLEANCSLPPSRPAVEFSFTLNNLPVSSLIVNIFELRSQ